jgi:hypothetical protein
MPYNDTVGFGIFSCNLRPEICELIVGGSALADDATVPPSVVMLRQELAIHNNIWDNNYGRSLPRPQ